MGSPTESKGAQRDQQHNQGNRSNLYDRRRACSRGGSDGLCEARQRTRCPRRRHVRQRFRPPSSRSSAMTVASSSSSRSTRTSSASSGMSRSRTTARSCSRASAPRATRVARSASSVASSAPSRARSSPPPRASGETCTATLTIPAKPVVTDPTKPVTDPTKPVTDPATVGHDVNDDNGNDPAASRCQRGQPRQQWPRQGRRRRRSAVTTGTTTKAPSLPGSATLSPRALLFRTHASRAPQPGSRRLPCPTPAPAPAQS